MLRSSMKKVLVALSGGVDSSVAALLLKQQGFQVTAVTMCLGVKTDNEKACCSQAAIESAKAVADKLDIAHYVLDFSADMQSQVIEDFIKEYSLGRTPNPCVRCNQFLKFNKLLKYAISGGFDYLSTGHYAKIVTEKEKFLLKKPKDLKKDQTYFLYCIKKEDLSSILFPLAEFTKQEVCQIAKDNSLVSAEKKESQDICFIDQGRYKDFIKKQKGANLSGEIVDTQGKVLDHHNGLYNYTVGQRSGLGISASKPLYVVEVNLKTNQVVAGSKEDTLSQGLYLSNLNLLVDKLPEKLLVKIRYNQKAFAAKVVGAGLAPCWAQAPARNNDLTGDRKGRPYSKIIFNQPQEAVTAGQSVVFYQDDFVLGGGIIEKAIK